MNADRTPSATSHARVGSVHPAWLAACLAALVSLAGRLLAADFNDPHADREALPGVPPGFLVSFFASEPLVRQPCSMAFDTGFNWVGTDNDETTGDRVFMPFFGAHFGWNHPGILLEESGLSLTLGLATGKRRLIPKSRIAGRRKAASSAMPGYDMLLTPPHVADLAGYVLAQRSGSNDIRKPAGSASSTGTTRSHPWPQGGGFRVVQEADRLVIAHSGRPVAHHVFHDSAILRPYFAHVHTPDGIQVTRNHPPKAGQDPDDHASMHPGLWLGFGDIAGEDFWRNKGTIRHDRFAASPTATESQLRFATESTLIARDGREMARQLSEFTITSHSNAYQIVWSADVTPVIDGFYFGDQEEMGLGARVATGLAEKEGGVITSSSGEQGAKNTWGRGYEWCDYSGVLHGRRAGIMIMADPSNLSPSWWHNRDYGVFVANPFGRASMKQGSVSRLEVKRGETFRLRFAILLHSSDPRSPSDLPSAYRRFSDARPR